MSTKKTRMSKLEKIYELQVTNKGLKEQNRNLRKELASKRGGTVAASFFRQQNKRKRFIRSIIGVVSARVFSHGCPCKRSADETGTGNRSKHNSRKFAVVNACQATKAPTIPPAQRKKKSKLEKIYELQTTNKWLKEEHRNLQRELQQQKNRKRSTRSIIRVIAARLVSLCCPRHWSSRWRNSKAKAPGDESEAKVAKGPKREPEKVKRCGQVCTANKERGPPGSEREAQGNETGSQDR